MALMSHGHLLETALRRRKRRQLTAGGAFGSFGAAVVAAICLSEGLHPFVVACAGAIGFIVGFVLAERVPDEPPRGMKDYSFRHGLPIYRNELPPVTPLLLHPFGSTPGFVFGEHPSGYVGRIGTFNFVKAPRMYFNFVMRVITRFHWPASKGTTMLAATRKVPAVRELLPVLLCEQRYGGRYLDGVDETIRGLEHVRLESVALDRRYEVFTHPRQEPVWVKRLFSPSFVHWLSDEVDERISFEIFDGWITVAVPTKVDDLTAEEFERIDQLAFRICSTIEREIEETQLERPPALLT